MATHSSILAWRIPWTEEPGAIVRHDWAANTFAFHQVLWWIQLLNISVNKPVDSFWYLWLYFFFPYKCQSLCWSDNILVFILLKTFDSYFKAFNLNIAFVHSLSSFHCSHFLGSFRVTSHSHYFIYHLSTSVISFGFLGSYFWFQLTFPLRCHKVNLNPNLNSFSD